MTEQASPAEISATDAPSFLCLFYLGIHKYGTAGTKIDRVFCEQCFVCKILYTVVQGLREGFDKGTAAGGTCFIELYAVYSAVFRS